MKKKKKKKKTVEEALLSLGACGLARSRFSGMTLEEAWKAAGTSDLTWAIRFYFGGDEMVSQVRAIAAMTLRDKWLSEGRQLCTCGNPGCTYDADTAGELADIIRSLVPTPTWEDVKAAKKYRAGRGDSPWVLV